MSEGSSRWEELNFLTEDMDIEFIRVEDVLISPQTVKLLNENFSNRANSPQPSNADGGSIAPPQVVYGIVDLVKQQFLALHGPVEEVLGYPPEILQSLRFMENVHPDDRDATTVVLSTILQGKHIDEFVFRIMKPDGTEASIKMSGTPADRGILAFYCSLALPEPPENPQRIHGYHRGELTGRNSLDFIADPDQEIFQETLRDILANRGTPGDAWHKPTRFKRIHADGNQLVEVENIVLGADFPKGRIHVLERVPSKPDNLYHFLYDMLGNILTCRSASDLAGKDRSVHSIGIGEEQST